MERERKLKASLFNEIWISGLSFALMLSSRLFREVVALEKPRWRLIVWQKSVELTPEIYRLTQKFPANEQCGLVG
jgi:hypothetical protein